MKATFHVVLFFAALLTFGSFYSCSKDDDTTSAAVENYLTLLGETHTYEAGSASDCASNDISIFGCGDMSYMDSPELGENQEYVFSIEFLDAIPTSQQTYSLNDSSFSETYCPSDGAFIVVQTPNAVYYSRQGSVSIEGDGLRSTAEFKNVTFYRRSNGATTTISGKVTCE